MSIEDITVFAQVIFDFVKVFVHLGCVALEEATYSPAEQGVSCEGALIRFEGQNLFALVCFHLPLLLTLFHLYGYPFYLRHLWDEMVDSMSSSMAWNFIHIHTSPIQ